MSGPGSEAIGTKASADRPLEPLYADKMSDIHLQELSQKAFNGFRKLMTGPSKSRQDSKSETLPS
jgi:hypothetical protein